MPVTAIIAIQSEYSMMEWMFEKDVIPTCKKLSIGFVPFSPLASGFLSGKYKADRTYTGDDVRRVITRFSKENVLANQPLLDLIANFANQKRCYPAQISLAWMLHKKDFIVPIPGARKPERIQENLSAADIELTDNEFNQIEAELAKIEIHGDRTDEDIAEWRT
jgi:aryl-alcohol dehydrogenase-like predicted oxidoreductase